MKTIHIKTGIVLVLVILVIYFDFRILEPFLEPLAWAGILTITIYPLHQWISSKVKKPRNASLLTLLILTTLLIIPALLITGAFIKQGIGFFQGIETNAVISRIQGFADSISQRLPFTPPDLESKMGEAAQTIGSFLAQESAGFLGSIAGFLFDFTIMLMVMFYLLRDGSGLLAFLRETSPFESSQTDEILEELSLMVKASLQSNVVVAFSQGFLAGLVFWILSVPAPLFWGVVSGVLAFLPLIAPALIWGGAAVALLIQGEIWRGIAMLLLGSCVISGIDNILRPAVISGKSKMNGAIAFVFLFGGIYLFGFLGIVLGPVMAAVSVGIFRGYRKAIA